MYNYVYSTYIPTNKCFLLAFIPSQPQRLLKKWSPNQELCFQFVLLSIEHVPHILWEPLSGYWVNDWHWESKDRGVGKHVLPTTNIYKCLKDLESSHLPPPPPPLLSVLTCHHFQVLLAHLPPPELHYPIRLCPLFLSHYYTLSQHLFSHPVLLEPGYPL